LTTVIYAAAALAGAATVPAGSVMAAAEIAAARVRVPAAATAITRDRFPDMNEGVDEWRTNEGPK
jgi:Na+/H+-dicarboxylate symporter